MDKQKLQIGGDCIRYQHALEIHERIEEVLRLIETGQYSTPALAEKVGVSNPTISRIVAALREQGHDIHAERTSSGWRYVLNAKPVSKNRGKPPQGELGTSRASSTNDH